MASRTVFRALAVESPPQYKPANATVAPGGKFNFAREELKVLASLSTSEWTMVWLLLMRLSVPRVCALVQSAPAPVAPVTWRQVVLAFAAIVMSPAALTVKRGAKVRCIAWAGSLQTNAQAASHMTRKPDKYRLARCECVAPKFKAAH